MKKPKVIDSTIKIKVGGIKLVLLNAYYITRIIKTEAAREVETLIYETGYRFI